MSQSVASIAMELKDARKRLGLTQAVLAKRSGISRTALNSIEKGTINMSVETLLRLLDVLGMDLRIVRKPVDRGRVAGRFPNMDELKKMRLDGEI